MIVAAPTPRSGNGNEAAGAEPDIDEAAATQKALLQWMREEGEYEDKPHEHRPRCRTDERRQTGIDRWDMRADEQMSTFSSADICGTVAGDSPPAPASEGIMNSSQDAPKRPKSGYMIFADGIRESVLEKVRADGRGLEEAGRIIKKRWAELSEAKKRDYHEKSQKMKIACDKDLQVQNNKTNKLAERRQQAERYSKKAERYRKKAERCRKKAASREIQQEGREMQKEGISEESTKRRSWGGPWKNVSARKPQVLTERLEKYERKLTKAAKKGEDTEKYQAKVDKCKAKIQKLGKKKVLTERLEKYERKLTRAAKKGEDTEKYQAKVDKCKAKIAAQKKAEQAQASMSSGSRAGVGRIVAGYMPPVPASEGNMNSSQDAPKRPKSDNMIFADEMRESVMEKVKADGRVLGEAGRIILGRRAELSKAKTREYDEKSQKMKTACDKDGTVPIAGKWVDDMLDLPLSAVQSLRFSPSSNDSENEIHSELGKEDMLQHIATPQRKLSDKNHSKEKKHQKGKKSERHRRQPRLVNTDGKSRRPRDGSSVLGRKEDNANGQSQYIDLVTDEDCTAEEIATKLAAAFVHAVESDAVIVDDSGGSPVPAVPVAVDDPYFIR